MSKRLKNTISAHDGNGRSRQIQEWVRMATVGSLIGDGDGQIEGMHELRTDNERHTVTSLGDGKYKVIETGEILTADEPLKD